jgi:predicted secreted protein
MYLAEDLARERHQLAVRDSEQMGRARRLIAARRARRRAERTACVAREAALQASLAQQSLL